MARGRWLRLRLTLVAAALLIGAEPTAGQTQGSDDLTALSEQVRRLDSQGKYAEAVSLAEQNVALARLQHGEKRSEFATAMAWLAYVYQDQGRVAEAEPLYRRALETYEKVLGPDNPAVATALNNLATLYQDQGRVAEAESLMKRAVAITEKAMGVEHLDVGIVLNNLAELYSARGRYAEAEPLYQRSLAIRETALGRDQPDVAIALNNLAGLRASQSDWAGAVDYWRRSTAAVVRRTQRGTDNAGQSPAGKRKGEPEPSNLEFQELVKAAHRLAAQDEGQRTTLAAEMFQAAQSAQGSEIAASLVQIGARGAEGDPTLAALVHARQNAIEEWYKREGMRSAAAGRAPDKRDRATEATNLLRLGAVDKRIAEFDKALEAKFPDYVALARPAPLSVQDVQAQLLADEALILFLDTREWKPMPEETFIWVITKTGMRWLRSELGTAALTREVAALRCGLDAQLWDDSKTAARCRDLVKAEPKRDRAGSVLAATLPFDAARAYALYKALFGQAEDLIRDKHLLIVPSGPVTQLPFHVLVTASVEGGRPAGPEPDYRAVSWLARGHATTVLPAVSSLKALRRVARPSAAVKPMIGFGNPLLDGNVRERPWEARWAAAARDKTCKDLPVQQTAEAAHKTRGMLRVARREGQADLDDVRSLTPLPDTADELCGIAKDLKLSPDAVWLGAGATETNIKTLSGDGRLAQYQVVHLATHGALIGEISGSSEPGLIFTPPKQATDLDDGYLSASEVAALKLDASWVILSAWNTAAGGAQGAEALSELARAFFYAGARALLVSHWDADSAATVKLITAAVGAATRDAKLGRAEALRRAMLALIDNGEPHQAHPAFWAPFVVMGEGAK